MHYTVTVKLDQRLELTKATVEAEVARLMAPYCERLEKAFKDETAEAKSKYKKSVNMVLEEPAPGEEYWRMFSPYDERYRSTDQDKIGVFEPPKENTLKVPLKVLYPSFDLFAEKYMGYQKNGKKYGYWHNPDGKWDWYEIGGRWSRFYPCGESTPGIIGSCAVWGDKNKRDPKIYRDAIRVDDVAFDMVAFGAVNTGRELYETYSKALESDNVYQVLSKREDIDLWHKLTCLGAIQFTEEPMGKEISGRKEFTTPRGDKYIINCISYDEFMNRSTTVFNPISTYAWLDESGWEEADETGANAYLEYKSQQIDKIRKLRDEEPRAILVCVDYHS